MNSELRERDLLHLILDYCAAMRIFVQRRNVGAFKIGTRYIRFAKPGQSDLWGLYGGRHFECELKRPGKALTEAQFEWLAECRNHGAIAFMADSLETFIQGLTESV